METERLWNLEEGSPHGTLSRTYRTGITLAAENLSGGLARVEVIDMTFPIAL
jgi:hypothetical protein